jgi:hypothetical protein
MKITIEVTLEAGQPSSQRVSPVTVAVLDHRNQEVVLLTPASSSHIVEPFVLRSLGLARYGLSLPSSAGAGGIQKLQ